MNIVNSCVDFLWETPDLERQIVKAARTCYQSEDKVENDLDFIRRLVKKEHEAMFEHGVISLRITCDRGIANELVRHRLCSFAQESTRYVRYDEIEVILPTEFKSETSEKIWRDAMSSCEKAYCELLSLGLKPQIARSVLPMALKTELVVTCNVREWRHIMKIRGHKTAHPQMRQIISMIKSWFSENHKVFIEDIL